MPPVIPFPDGDAIPVSQSLLLREDQLLLDATLIVLSNWLGLSEISMSVGDVETRMI